MAPSQTQNWNIEHLFKTAFIRTKERFLSFFIVTLLIYLMGLGEGLLFVLGALLVGIIFGVSHSAMVAVIVGVIAFILFIMVAVYIGSWGILTTIDVMLQEEKIGATATFSKMRPLVWNFWIVNLLSMLFFLGLFVTGILTLFILPLLWMFWGSFMAFVYLDQKKSGLDNLWTSRAMVGQKFGVISGRMFILIAAYLFIIYLLGSTGKGAFQVLIPIFSFLMGPFTIAYNYEMYRNLEKPSVVKKPIISIVLSTAGLLLFALCIFAVIFYSGTFVNGFMKGIQNMPKQQYENSGLPAMPKEIPLPSARGVKGI